MFLDPMLPAPPVGPRMDFWTPLNKTPEPVLVLSPRIVAHFIHYDRRTLPCTLQTDQAGDVVHECEHCSKGSLPRRWRGYLHVYRLHSAGYAFLCLPEGTGSALQQLHGFGFDYRGLIAKVSRFAGAKNKPLIFELQPHTERRTELPEAIDPTPYLERVFRVKRALPQS